jgi:hypothetical protein
MSCTLDLDHGLRFARGGIEAPCLADRNAFIGCPVPDSNFWFRTKAEHFPYRPEPGAANRPGTYNRDFDDRYRQVYRAPSQAGSGNDIYTGSPGLRKAPMWARQPGRYSGSSGPVPGDDVLVDMRAAIVGRDNFAIERNLLRLPAL